MFDSVEAVRFDREMSNGRTKPILINCERINGDEVEVVAKFSFGCDNSPNGLIREALAAMLAKDLGLPVPEPFLVSITPEFIASVENQAVLHILKNSNKHGFGSHKLPDGFGVWTASSGRMSKKLEQEALEVFAFDAWLTNADRRIKNPNLLTDGRSFAIFDHEYTLMTDLNLGWQPPWIKGALAGFNAPTNHVFYQSLKGVAGLDLSRICTAMSSISDERINEYAQAIPASWQHGSTALAQGVDFISQLRENVQLSADELLRSLK
jgi:hypothetical protein